MATGKSTGMVRKLDALGRIVLPAELRGVLGIEVGDPLEFFVDVSYGQLTLRKYRTLECMFCASTENLSYFREYFICRSCLGQISGKEGLPTAAVSNPEVAVTKELGFKPKQTRSKETLARLVKIMEQYPDASQQKWAELIGMSQGRVSQLVKKLHLDRLQ